MFGPDSCAKIARRLAARVSPAACGSLLPAQLAGLDKQDSATDGNTAMHAAALTGNKLIAARLRAPGAGVDAEIRNTSIVYSLGNRV
jgi:ankyrin repeat protein